jgi:hypothetical protein
VTRLHAGLHFGVLGGLLALDLGQLHLGRFSAIGLVLDFGSHLHVSFIGDLQSNAAAAQPVDLFTPFGQVQKQMAWWALGERQLRNTKAWFRARRFEKGDSGRPEVWTWVYRLANPTGQSLIGSGGRCEQGDGDNSV